MHLTTNVLGSFVLKNGRILKQKLFSSDAAETAKRLRASEETYCQEEADLLNWLIETQNKRVYVTNPTRFRGAGFKIAFIDEDERPSVYRIAAEIQVEKSQVDAAIRKVNRLLVRERLKEIQRDQVLMQAVNSLDDLDEAINRLVERLREWYSLHFPELDDLVVAHDTYSKLVLDVGAREGYAQAKLNFDAGLNEKIAKCSKDSLGVEFKQQDISAVKVLAKAIMDLHEAKEGIEAYIGVIIEEVAPNVNALTGPLLGARLISLAHGLDRLATLPAGTIQLLGAEDAFFRFLRSGKKPPKHGVIFQLPAIRGAQRNKRGKIARSFAAKVALASRADAYGGAFIADKLKADLERRIKSIG
jgi:nucleolar protein 56